MYPLQEVPGQENFNNWLKGDACRKQASGRQRKAAFEDRHKEEVKAARRAREQFTFQDTDSENEEGPIKEEKNVSKLKKPTEEDEQEIAELNETIKSESRNGIGSEFCKKQKVKQQIKIRFKEPTEVQPGGDLEKEPEGTTKDETGGKAKN